jgi:hypothetical protein
MFVYAKFTERFVQSEKTVVPFEKTSEEIETEHWVLLPPGAENTITRFKLIDDVPTVLTPEQHEAELLQETWETRLMFLRMKRNQLLQQSDWTQFSHVAPEIQSVWETYRQQLRDIPTNLTRSDDPSAVEFPTAP